MGACRFEKGIQKEAGPRPGPWFAFARGVISGRMAVSWPGPVRPGPVGPGRVGSGRVGSGRVGSGPLTRSRRPFHDHVLLLLSIMFIILFFLLFGGWWATFVSQNPHLPWFYWFSGAMDPAIGSVIPYYVYNDI